MPTPQRNTFSGFKHGVEASGDNLTGHTFRISSATFDRCGVGIYARTNNHFAVENSTFTVGNAPFNYTVQCSQNFGIRALDYCDGIRVANNTFTGTGSTFFRTLGVSLERTGDDNKEVHGNRFSGLNYGVYAEGQNGFLTNYRNTGALITCNEFANNEEAITVNWRSNIHIQQSHQGYSSGNTFSAGQLIANYNTPGAFPVQYFHHGGNSVPNAYQFQLVGPMPQKACSTASPEYPDNPTFFFRDQFTQARAHYQDLLTGYNSRIDVGETQVRLDFIQNAQAADTPGIRLQSAQTAPYVSGEVFRLLGNRQLLDANTYVALLWQNPDLLRQELFRRYLRDSLSGYLPADAYDYLMAGSGEVTSRGREEGELQAAYNTLRSHAHSWVRAIKTDTVAFSVAELAEAYTEAGELPDAWLLAGLYMASGNSAEADQVMNDLPEKYTLTPAQAALHNSYSQLWNILRDKDWSRRMPGGIDSATLLELAQLRNAENGHASAIAGMLEDTRHELFPLVPCPIGWLIEGKAASGVQQANSRSAAFPLPKAEQMPAAGSAPAGRASTAFRILPNPNAGKFRVEYQSLGAACTLEIRTMQGRLLRTLALPTDRSLLEVTLPDLAPGSYTARLLRNHIPAGTITFIVLP